MIAEPTPISSPKRPHQHHSWCKPGDSCWPEPQRRPRSASVFGRQLGPGVLRFFVGHYPEIASLAEASDEDAVRDLREALRYEFDHLKPGRIPCRCGDRTLTFPPAVTGGASVGGRSFSDIVPSIETAYQALPIAWRGRTKVYLMMLGHSEQDIYELKQDRPKTATGWPVKGSSSAFDRFHVERLRSELRSPGFRARPQDADDEEGDSVWRRMAASLGWLSPESRQTLIEQEKQAA